MLSSVVHDWLKCQTNMTHDLVDGRSDFGVNFGPEILQLGAYSFGGRGDFFLLDARLTSYPAKDV